MKFKTCITLMSMLSMAGCVSNDADKKTELTPIATNNPLFETYEVQLPDNTKYFVNINKSEPKEMSVNSIHFGKITMKDATIQFGVEFNESIRPYPVEIIDEETGYDIDAKYFIEGVKNDKLSKFSFSTADGCKSYVEVESNTASGCGISIKKI